VEETAYFKNSSAMHIEDWKFVKNYISVTKLKFRKVDVLSHAGISFDAGPGSVYLPSSLAFHSKYCQYFNHTVILGN